jgi:hypothetical protein
MQLRLFASSPNVNRASNCLVLLTTLKSWQFAINVNRSAICAGKRVFRRPVTNARSLWPAELARSVPRARPSVFSRNAIAGQRPAATTLFPLLISILT